MVQIQAANKTAFEEKCRFLSRINKIFIWERRGKAYGFGCSMLNFEKKTKQVLKTPNMLF